MPVCPRCGGGAQRLRYSTIRWRNRDDDKRDAEAAEIERLQR